MSVEGESCGRGPRRHGVEEREWKEESFMPRGLSRGDGRGCRGEAPGAVVCAGMARRVYHWIWNEATVVPW